MMNMQHMMMIHTRQTGRSQAWVMWNHC